MKRALFALLLASGLFADFNSLAEEKAFQAEQKQKEEAQKQESKKKFEEIVIPRINNLKAFNDRFYEKYLVKKSDTQEMIDNKFKNRAKLYSELRRDLEASEAEYKILRKASDKMCVGDYCSLDISLIKSGVPREYLDVWGSLFMSIDPIYGEEEEDRKRALKDGYTSYEDYLREAYASYEERQKWVKKAQQMEAEDAKKLQGYEAREKAIAAERKRVEPACKKWRADARRRVYSLGVGDKIVSSNGVIYGVSGVNANTFTVKSPLMGTYIYLQKDTCIPQAALRNAPSPYCYQ